VLKLRVVTSDISAARSKLTAPTPIKKGSDRERPRSDTSILATPSCRKIMYSVRLIWVSFVRRTKTSSCGLNYAHLLEWTQGVFGEGPAVQHRPLQHTLPGGQHFVPQQLEL